MRAVAVDAERRLVLAEVAPPARAPHEALVEVRAFSLNRGEVHTALTQSAAGDRPGADFAGVVVEPPDGSGFKPGDRVVGIKPGAAWAERIVVPSVLLAPLPDGTSFDQASALPTAGLTAEYALAKAGELSRKKVLISGATGGVGVIAVQLAAQAGAHVVAHARNPEHVALLRRLGAHAVALTTDDAAGRYDLIFESLGGAFLGEALGWLASRGVCVLVGNSAGTVTTFDASKFRHGDGTGIYGGTTMYGFYLGEELWRALPGAPLAALAAKVAAGTLDPMVEVVEPWTNVDRVARDLMDRRFVGKAVLTVG